MNGLDKGMLIKAYKGVKVPVPQSRQVVWVNVISHILWPILKFLTNSARPVKFVRYFHTESNMLVMVSYLCLGPLGYHLSRVSSSSF